jgi:hypothetical protein
MPAKIMFLADRKQDLKKICENSWPVEKVFRHLPKYIII